MPASTPAPIRNRLAEELQKALADADVRKSLFDFGLEVTPGDARQMADYIESETKVWLPVIRERNIRLEN